VSLVSGRVAVAIAPNMSPAARCRADEPVRLVFPPDSPRSGMSATSLVPLVKDRHYPPNRASSPLSPQHVLETGFRSSTGDMDLALAEGRVVVAVVLVPGLETHLGRRHPMTSQSLPSGLSWKTRDPKESTRSHPRAPGGSHVAAIGNHQGRSVLDHCYITAIWGGRGRTCARPPSGVSDHLQRGASPAELERLAQRGRAGVEWTALTQKSRLLRISPRTIVSPARKERGRIQSERMMPLNT